ncbi:MAG: IS5/IS1182 family transposase, partial [Alphaproteobacteria bacterium]
RHGDHANAVLSAVGYNFRLILKWLRVLLRLILAALFATIGPAPGLKRAS